jgi:hypothetical protein
MEENHNDSNSSECHELKNIKYKTMLLNGNPLQETKSSNDLSNLDKFLENEKNNNSCEPWCKFLAFYTPGHETDAHNLS